MGKEDKNYKGLSGRPLSQIGFLLAQIGAHAAAKFSERIRPLGISPGHAGIVRILARTSGMSQRELCSKLSILPSRLVVLLDEMEEKGIVERRDDPKDRRSYSLYLTAKGQTLMTSLSEVAKAHGDALSAGLTAEECQRLGEILAKVASHQGLTPGVHPGYRTP